MPLNSLSGDELTQISMCGSLPIDGVDGPTELHRSDSSPLWPGTWRHGELELALDGYVVWPDRLLLGRSSEDRHRLAEAVEGSPTSLAREVKNGAFNIVVHDQERCRTLFVSDCLGLVPLYMCRGKGRLYFASDLKTLTRMTGEGQELDLTGVAELYHFGYQLGDRTAYKGVSLLPAGSVMTVSWQNGHVDCRETELGAEALCTLSCSSDSEWVAEVARRARGACDRLHDSGMKYGIKISGGMDSRLIAASLNYDSIVSCTWGDANSVEMRIGGALASALGYRHVEIPVTGDFFTSFYPSMHERFGLMEFFHEHATSRFLEHGCEAVLDGLGGDVFVGGLFLKRSSSAGDMIASALGGKVKERELPKDDSEVAACLFDTLRVKDSSLPILTDEARELISSRQSAIMEDLVAQLRRYRSRVHNLDSLIARVKLANRTRRYIALQTAPARPRLQTLFPFLDRDLMKVAVALPSQLTANKLLYLLLFSREFPAIRHVPPIMSRLPFTVPIRLHYAGRVARRLRELAGYRVMRATRGRVQLATMEATQWEKWLATNSEFRGAVESHLRKSGMVNSVSLSSAFDEVSRFRRFVSGTRLMLTTSFCSWWR